MEKDEERGERLIMPKVRTKDIIEQFQLELVSGAEGIYRPITTSDLSRPGIEMAGYFAYYPAERLQLLGRTELSFYETLTRKKSGRGCSGFVPILRPELSSRVA